jgi:hypothetical protein
MAGRVFLSVFHVSENANHATFLTCRKFRSSSPCNEWQFG